MEQALITFTGQLGEIITDILPVFFWIIGGAIALFAIGLIFKSIRAGIKHLTRGRI